MREILFKAKRLNNDEWVEGCYMLRPNSPGKARYYIVEAGEAKWFEIDPSTICQYTGLTDRNGKKIWENDIVETPYRRFVVTYTDGVWGDEDGVAMRESIFGEGGTVIGNVFDNCGILEREVSENAKNEN